MAIVPDLNNARCIPRIVQLFKTIVWFISSLCSISVSGGKNSQTFANKFVT